MRQLLHLPAIAKRQLKALGLRTSILMSIAIVAGLIFSRLAWGVSEGYTFSLDHRATRWAQALGSPSLDTFMRTVTVAGNGLSLVAFAVVLAAYLFFRRSIRCGIAFLSVAITAGLLNWLLKL